MTFIWKVSDIFFSSFAHPSPSFLFPSFPFLLALKLWIQLEFLSLFSLLTIISETQLVWQAEADFEPTTQWKASFSSSPGQTVWFPKSLVSFTASFPNRVILVSLLFHYVTNFQYFIIFVVFPWTVSSNSFHEIKWLSGVIYLFNF